MNSSITAEQWPQWLPAPTLQDNELHWVRRRGENGACGQPVMRVDPGHETRKRRRCARCQQHAQKYGPRDE